MFILFQIKGIVSTEQRMLCTLRSSTSSKVDEKTWNKNAPWHSEKQIWRWRGMRYSMVYILKSGKTWWNVKPQTNRNPTRNAIRNHRPWNIPELQHWKKKTTKHTTTQGEMIEMMVYTPDLGGFRNGLINAGCLKTSANWMDAKWNRRSIHLKNMSSKWESFPR